ncbi:NACHT, LRR and PYD domains-containing protein 13 isoform X2 [Impatiens glandulifera]|uniref:NACHT, LRR and PYD domains-containing protein 13 isoform X2 n=1 Tax=Impatiens glandulifera TaxID=253017 RepID=UPI001FB0AE4F|nr:NACHT, LRR and PYD domains-containing protein 13 isoform X2 [Impatiens glandulifera]
MAMWVIYLFQVESILNAIGYECPLGVSQCNFSKLSYHCHKFGAFARYLSLQNVLCSEEICSLLNNSRLKGLELWWIKSKEHVNGLCRLLRQNNETLKSIALSHCKLSSSLVDEICLSLLKKGLQTHGIKHFAIKSSRFSESNQTSSPRGIATFLASGRLLSSLTFSDDRLGPNDAGMVLTTLLDDSSRIVSLDLSENNITGWMTHFRCSSTVLSNPSLEIEKSLSLLSLLNLRACNLHGNDIKNLQNALFYMPKLETLDISDNPIEDQGIKNLVPVLVELSKRHSGIANLKVENCDLSSEGVDELLTGLSTLKRPLQSLSIRENDLGRPIGRSLGKFLGIGIQVLDIEEIGLGSNGFLEAVEEIRTDLNLVSINISKNRGGIGMVIFLKKLISRAPQLAIVKAGFNFMPVESLSEICSAMKIAKGKLEHVDLTGNTWSDKAYDISFLDEFSINGKSIFILPLLGGATYEPYDDEP